MDMEQKTDYMQGFVVDYGKDDMTSGNFMAVMTGNVSAIKGGNGRVLNT
jgi:hypothetical protein